jgi:hypothetical protein
VNLLATQGKVPFDSFRQISNSTMKQVLAEFSNSGSVSNREFPVGSRPRNKSVRVDRIWNEPRLSTVAQLECSDDLMARTIDRNDVLESPEQGLLGRPRDNIIWSGENCVICKERRSDDLDSGSEPLVPRRYECF